MPILTLKFKDTPVKKFRIKKGVSLTIGRLNDNDLVIENLAVSGHHAKIDSVGEGYLLTDLQSKNGSFVNRQLVASHWLKHGDVITVGKHDLEFAYEEGEARPEEAADMDQTMVMDTKSQRELLAKSFAQLEPQLQEKEPIGLLSFLAGGQGEVKLTKKLIKIGKASTSDIVVGGLTMGQTAATISKRPNGYFLSYVGGMSKPSVNGSTVKESVQLNEFDMIEIGSLKMQFVLEKGE